MSVLPLLFNNWWDDYDYHPYMCQPAMRQQSRPALVCASYAVPKYHQRAANSALAERGSKVNIDKDKFEVLCDVQQFAPNEINVKIVDDYIVIEGKHEEKPDEHGYISREFSRRYKIPSDVDPKTIKPSLSSDGMLALRAPLKSAEPPAPKERVIPITHTGQPARKKEAEKEKIEQKK